MGCESPAPSHPPAWRGGSPRGRGMVSAHRSDSTNPDSWWQWDAANLQRFHASAQRVAELCCLCVDKARQQPRGGSWGRGMGDTAPAENLGLLLARLSAPVVLLCSLGQAGGFLSLLMLFGLSLQSGQFNEDMIPTVGFNMRKITKGNVTIKLWDIGGQPRFRSMWERYCRGVSAIVYMVDAADQEKIEASKNELHNLLDKPQLQGIPVSCCLGGIPSPSATHTIPTATHTTSPLHSY